MEILKEVFFVRHGETDSNVDGVLRGHRSMLTEKGKKQAKIVAERMQKIGIDALVSSSFPRALDTAAEIAGATGMSIVQSDLLTEWVEASCMLDKPKDHPEVAEAYSAIFSAEQHDYRHSDEETFTELVRRGRASLEFLAAHPGKRIGVVTHGAFLRVLFGDIVFRDRFTRRQFVDLFNLLVTTNTGISHARLTNDRSWQFVTWNDSAHLG